ncbi:MAG: hypothetical protein NT002_03760 [candidate division Zixibacteria bacterium]|nr:hypothetical protein [candidate division Zixibacteria bacterium]
MNRKFFMVLAAMLAIVFALSFNAAAQVPNTIMYQGRLTDAAGAPISTATSVVFSIYATIGADTPVWTETIADVAPDVQGVFTVELGLVTPLPANLFDGTKKYLGIKVGADTEMNPRQVLTSGPYSLNANIGDGTVTTAKIANGAVLDTKLGTGSVIESKIANYAVTTLKILDGAVTSGKIADGAINSAKIADLSVATIDIADNAINSAKVADGSITTAKIADGTVTSAKIADLSIGTIDIADNAITGAKVANSSLDHGDIGDEAGISSIYDGTDNSLTGTVAAVDSVSITCPSGGYLVIEAAGFLQTYHTLNAGAFALRVCLSTTRASMDYTNFVLYEIPTGSATGTYNVPFTLLMTSVVSAGSYKYYLNADAFSGAGYVASGSTGRIHIVATYYPSAYGSVASTNSPAPLKPGNSDGSTE